MASPLVWVELAPSAFWLDLAVVVETLLLVGYCNSTSGISLKAACSKPSIMVERFSVCGWFWAKAGGKASSLGYERHWLILLGGIIKVIFRLRTRWVPNVGIQKSKVVKSWTRRWRKMNEGVCEGEDAHTGKINASNNSSQVSHPWAPGGSIYRRNQWV
jgi:hypothetical protein